MIKIYIVVKQCDVRRPHFIRSQNVTTFSIAPLLGRIPKSFYHYQIFAATFQTWPAAEKALTQHLQSVRVSQSGVGSHDYNSIRARRRRISLNNKKRNTKTITPTSEFGEMSPLWNPVALRTISCANALAAFYCVSPTDLFYLLATAAPPPRIDSSSRVSAGAKVVLY